MTKIKTVLAASSALMIMAAAPAFAQSSYGSGTQAPAAKTEVMKDKAMKKAKKEAMKKAKKEGKEMVEDAMMKGKTSYGSGEKVEGVMMEKGEAMMKDEAKSYGSGEKTMMKKDGMVEDAMMKDHSMTGDHMMKEKMSAPTQVQAPVQLNCPAGTKGQADGTCMIVDSNLYPS